MGLLTRLAVAKVLFCTGALASAITVAAGLGVVAACCVCARNARARERKPEIGERPAT